MEQWAEQDDDFEPEPTFDIVEKLVPAHRCPLCMADLDYIQIQEPLVYMIMDHFCMWKLTWGIHLGEKVEELLASGYGDVYD